MKENASNCQHAWSDDGIYKEVVVIGNGPSGMVTSFMLAGHVPYLKNIPEDLPIDEMLKMRLLNLPSGQSLYEVDLLELAADLEGRSHNPIPLLFDSLLRPCADLDLHVEPLVEWKFDIDKQIDHVVLGRGACGGAWRSFPQDLKALSPRCWLTLPDATRDATDLRPDRNGCDTKSLKITEIEGDDRKCAKDNKNVGSVDGAPPINRSRPTAGEVVDYYAKYVRDCGLQRYFVNGVTVTGVTLAGARRGLDRPPPYTFVVHAVDATGRSIRYHCDRVVVACGACERRNRVAGVSLDLIDDQVKLCKALRALKDSCPTEEVKVLIVGSGLSAADGVVWTRRASAHAMHAHHAPSPTLATLDATIHPEYAEIYKMMSEGRAGQHRNYMSLFNYEIVDVTFDPTDKKAYRVEGLTDDCLRSKRVKLKNTATNEELEVTVSIIAVFVGSRPDLQFLQTNFKPDSVSCQTYPHPQIKTDRRFFQNQWCYFKSVLENGMRCCKSRYSTEINGNIASAKCYINCGAKTKDRNEIGAGCNCANFNPLSEGIGFGLDPSKSVNPRTNPIAVDKGSHEMIYAPKGVYALGPLTGDNFIRFIPGGALAIVADMHRVRKGNA